MLRNHGSKIGSILPIVLLFCLMLPAAKALAGKGDAIIRRVQSRFKSLNGLSVRFEVRYGVVGEDDTFEEAGRFQLDGQGRFRMETPRQTLVCDGSTFWTYDPLERQVLIYGADEKNGLFLTPSQLLYEYPVKYRVEEVKEELLSGRICDVLLMVPRDETDPTRMLKVWVDRDDNLTRRFLIEDLVGNITIFDFEAFELNLKLPDETFHFVPPENAEVIDMR